MPSGGVFTPTAAFYNTKSVFSRLEAAGIRYKPVVMDGLVRPIDG